MYTITATLWLTAVAIISQTMAANTFAEEEEALLVITLQPETKSHVDNENYDVITTIKATEVNKENEKKYDQTTTTKSFSNTSTIIPDVTATTTTTTTNQGQQRNFMNTHSNNHKHYESFSKAKLNSEPNRKQIMKNAKQTEQHQHTTNKGTNVKRNKIQQQHLLMPATAFLKTSIGVDPHIIITTTALEKRVITTTNKWKTNITKTDAKILTPQWGILKKPIPLITTNTTNAAYEQYKRKREIKQIKELEKDPPMADLKLQEIVTDAYKRMPTIVGAAVSTIASLQHALSSTSSYNIDPGQFHINEHNRIDTKKLLNVPTDITVNNLHSEEENLAALTRKNRTTTPKNHKRKNLMIYDDPSAPIKSFNEFTKKLLAEKDGIINDIEQKFRLKEFVSTSQQTISKTNIKQSTTATPFYNDIAHLSTLSSASLLPKTTQQQTIKMNQGQHIRKSALNSDNNSRGKFIKKRAKKSFEFPVHSAGKDIVSVVKTTDKNKQIIYNPDTIHQTEIIQRYNELSAVHNETKRLQPEFYTTKFFNSKLFHNKMHQYEKSQIKSIQKEKIANVSQINERENKNPPNLHNFTALHSRSLTKIIEHQHCSEDNRNCKMKKVTLKATLVPSITNEINQTTLSLIEPIKTMADHFNKTFALTKLNTVIVNLNSKDLVNSSTIDNSTIDSITTITHYTISGPTLPSTTVINNLSKTKFSSPLVNSMLFASNTAKSIARSNAVNRLQEKINLLECEVQNLPQGLQIWRSNETHELVLPIKTPQNCKDDVKCAAMIMSWEGESEIQSGDILIVQINDTLLNSQDSINTTDSAFYIKVYQVTRSGHEHCDVTEGILLDITPIILDDRKLVTLNDKDLTEGINLLIVVSELWDSQCVRLKVTTKSDNCGENADCSGKGVCYSTSALEEYECQCCSGFAGSRCEEINACSPSPCTNNGICVDLSQGHEGNSYQCLCPYGYTGKNCQYELDSCNSAECMNGGSCIGNSTYFRCECLPGFSGPLCQHSLNECESLPCVHGICVDQEDGFRCFCQPGFAGELCNFEYNECDSNPCQNDGECIDHIGSYECHCTKGYIGNRCQTKMDFCALKPCPIGHRCVDHGNDYSCECQGGHNGLNCNQVQKTQCNVNPCTHGGTCWSSGDSFYCACRPGYTGTMCEDEFVVETVVSSSEFMVDDASARNFNDKSYGSTIILKSPLELHNAYVAAAVLAAAIFIVATVLTICHCKVNQTYRKFPTRTFGLLHLFGFGRQQQTQYKFNKHWLSGKGLNVSTREVGGNPLRSASSSSATATTTKTSSICNHINNNNNKKNNTYRQLTTVNVATATSSRSDILQNHPDNQLHGGAFQRTVENDMYYTIDFGEHTQHSPLIQ